MATSNMLSERCSKMFCHNSGSEVLSTLKRRLSQYNLKRKKVDVDLSYVAEIDAKLAGWPRHHFWLQPRDVAYIGCVVRIKNKLLSVLEDEDSFIDICRIISKLKCY